MTLTLSSVLLPEVPSAHLKVGITVLIFTAGKKLRKGQLFARVTQLEVVELFWEPRSFVFQNGVHLNQHTEMHTNAYTYKHIHLYAYIYTCT